MKKLPQDRIRSQGTKVANGVPMKSIQEWLGHSTFNVTANYYIHLDYNSKISSAKTIAKLGGDDADNSADENVESAVQAQMGITHKNKKQSSTK